MTTARFRTASDPLNEFSLDAAPHGVPVLPVPVTGPPSQRSRGTVRRSGEVFLTSIGPVRVTDRRVYTPAVTLPLREVSWRVDNRVGAFQETPEWATVAGLVGIPFTLGLSLLLLTVKETVFSGHVKVTIRHTTGKYTMRLPVTSAGQIAHIHNAVAYVRRWIPRGSRAGHTMAA
ncbi:hypothetical protein AB0I28_09050 [Phytomonospora sp. NPDC050363]|uniref:hypothetical protein n=1 Tax=Phytomonospora sp. NPDC050363 TaxID=3155642 RepID=UPI0033CA9FFF